MIEYGPKQGSFILLPFQSTCFGLADTGRGVDKLGGLCAAGLPVSFLGALHRHVFNNCMTS
jgi:hypothetical protein